MSIGGTTHHRRTLTHKHFNMKEGVRIAIGKIRPFQKHPNSLEPKLGHFHEYVLYTLLLLLHSLHLDWHSFYTYVDTFADTYTHTPPLIHVTHTYVRAYAHQQPHFLPLTQAQALNLPFSQLFLLLLSLFFRAASHDVNGKVLTGVNA